MMLRLEVEAERATVHAVRKVSNQFLSGRRSTAHVRLGGSDEAGRRAGRSWGVTSQLW